MVDVPKGLGDVPSLLKRFGEARKLWELWRSLHQEAFDYSAPERETFYLRSPGQRKNRHIFDSTAVLGLGQFASRIQGSLIPSWQQWMDLESGSNVPEDQKKENDAALEEITKDFFSNLNHSNFSTEITPALSDLGIGTGAIMIEAGNFEADEVFKFTNVPLAELYLENPYGGPVKTVWRHHKVAVGKIMTIWPGAELTQQLKNKAKNEPFSEERLVNGMIYNHDDGKYHHVIICESEKALLFTQSFDTQRLIVFRWHLTPGEVYGRGPIMQVLPDIRTVNKVKEFTLQNAAIQISGVYTGVSDSLFNPHTVRIAPGVIIPVSQNGTQNPTLQALPRSGDIGLGNFIIEDLQNNIKKALFIDQLGDIQDPVRSATEIQIRNQEMLKQAGAQLGRLKTELIEQVVAAGIDIMRGLGKGPDIRIDGKDVSMRQTSPLAKAEDLEDFQNSQVWFSNVQNLAAVAGPEVVIGTVKIENLASYWGEKLGVPSDLGRTDDEKKQFGESAIKMAQLQAEQGGTQPQGGGGGGQAGPT